MWSYERLVPFSVRFARLRPKLGAVSPERSPDFAEVGGIWSKSVQIWPNSTKLGRSRLRIRRFRAGLARHRLMFGRTSARLDRSRLNFGRIRFGRHRPNSVESGPRLVERGPNAEIPLLLHAPMSPRPSHRHPKLGTPFLARSGASSALELSFNSKRRVPVSLWPR